MIDRTPCPASTKDGNPSAPGSKLRIGFIADLGRRAPVSDEPVCQWLRSKDLDDFFRRLHCELRFRIENTVLNDGSQMSVNLRITSQSDFGELAIIEQVDVLNQLHRTASDIGIVAQCSEIWPLLCAARDRPNTDLEQLISCLPFEQQVLLSISRAGMDASTWDRLTKTIKNLARSAFEFAPGHATWMVTALEKVVSRQLKPILEYSDLQAIATTWARVRAIVSAAESAVQPVTCVVVDSSSSVGVDVALHALRDCGALDCLFVDTTIHEKLFSSARNMPDNAGTVIWIGRKAAGGDEFESMHPSLGEIARKVATATSPTNEHFGVVQEGKDPTSARLTE